MPDTALAETAPAKINLHLHVVGRRADGYHLLDSLAAFAGAADALRYRPGGPLALALEGPEAGALAAEPDNLVLRAARLLAEAAGRAPGGTLVLEKHLPVASGIGGGSADAAAALRLLSRAWGLGWETARLAPLAARLGADVPVCLDSRAARMGGVGERLSAAPALPPAGLVLANPRVPLATPAVFRARQEMRPGGFSAEAALPAAWADAGAMARDLAACGNDLEAPAIALCPAVADVLAALRALPGCLLARMSGSGATCFGLFETPAAAAGAARHLPSAWWRWGGGFTTGGRPLYSAAGEPAGA
ncbi:4-(cytidine 5'-diphospho)-2-C-methyl-D-erythritol kinase [Pseudoroseomonas rhizosphaerae]|uniref:4-diphosphocytidyl-2-C-methyl-D-erythritol kinase n=1 Tax=Teichococcus rhizosphaerae TaxID=1335062 RepID=A0A2C7A594_9PROT|nr:4-(cytidine 5'-diphospho)-2-C-methyl-D-erythritol kinase [Pseudoroseomonas rhizosphaerae]PHK93149.1 4-(cytidine 5'-diphospho)-2-C-methyl-D-erythritol kinase [Pseudoroseomonas rhizosphaerae]